MLKLAKELAIRHKGRFDQHLQKKKFKAFLLDISERNIHQRRFPQRQKKIDALKNVKEGCSFEVKKTFVESRIEQINNYFEPRNNLTNPNKNWKNLLKKINKVQKHICKVERETECK